mgnify:CR=1 FL=1
MLRCPLKNGLQYVMYPSFLSLTAWYDTPLLPMPISCPMRGCDTNVLPIASAYEQYATNTLRVAGVMRGSLIALIGTTAQALRSLALSCLGLNTGSPLAGRSALAESMLRLATYPDLHDTCLSHSV